MWQGVHFVTLVKALIDFYFCLYFTYAEEIPLKFSVYMLLIFNLVKNLTCLKKPLLSAAIHDLATKYREEFNMPNLKIPYNNRQGFYFSIPQKEISGRLPDKFIQVLSSLPNELYSLIKRDISLLSVPVV